MTQDVYAKITARIVSALREGVVPWHQPWNAAQAQRAADYILGLDSLAEA